MNAVRRSKQISCAMIAPRFPLFMNGGYTMLQLPYVGGLGLMAGPAGTHLKADGPAKVLRVHDRGNPGAQRDAFRASWKAHGAELVRTFDALIGDGNSNALCCGAA